MRYILLSLLMCAPASAGIIAGGGLMNSVSASSAAATYVNKAGDTMTGTLNMTNVGVTLTGASGNVTSASSVTASSFFGNGANVTGVTAANVAAANVAAGSLGGSVIASSIAVNAVQDASVVAVSGSKVSGGIAGNSGTATALAANGANCAASSYPLGVDASGAAESCGTSISGNAGTVTTNANLTGGVTSVGNAATVVTNANLTGVVTSAGNATSIAAGALTDGTVYGQDIALSTIPLGALNQSGATLSQIAKWNGTIWAPADDATGGAGAAVLVDTQTFSGANTFTSSVTVGPTVYTTTAVTSGLSISTNSVLVNSWMVVASSRASGETSTRFTGLLPGREYNLIFTYSQAGATGSPGITFNSDTGANYKYATTGTRSDTGAVGSNVSVTGVECSLPTFVGVGAGDGSRLSAFFSTEPSDSTRVALTAARSGWNSTVFENSTSACRYDGAANLSSVTLSVSGGTYTGVIYLLQLIPGQGQ